MLPNLSQRICNTYQRSCWGGSNSQVWGFVIGSRSHPREEGSYTGTLHRKKIPPTKQKMNIQKLISYACTSPCSLHPGERKRLTPPSCHTIHQDIQIIILNIIFKLSFLQKTRPSPEYWLAIGIFIFITWDTVTSQRYYRKQVKSQKYFKGRLKPLASTKQALTCKKHSVL